MRKRATFVSAGLGVVALGLLTVGSVWHIERGRRSAGPDEVLFSDSPRPVPPFTVTDLDGRLISSSDWRGRVTIVNFWATWCAPCLIEIPDFVALQEEYRDHVQFVGLSVDEGSADTVREFVREHGINYGVAIVGPEVDATFGSVPGLPTSFVIDREGRIVQTHVGLVSPSVYEREIRALAGLPRRAGRPEGDP